MRLRAVTLLTAGRPRWLMLGMVCLALGGCANLQRHSSPAADTADDDAYCRSHAGAQGSDAYVECRKDRDHQRGLHENRIESQHRSMAERMLNGR